jgi:serine/threonine-protein kinase RsbW
MMSKMPNNSSVVVENELSAIVEISKQLISKLEDYDFSKEDVFAVKLAFQEAFLNAAIHGNNMSSEKKIRIGYSVESDKVEINLMDEGEGFDPDLVPDPRIGENLYKPAGRGLFLMRSYMDEVEFNEQGNGVRLVRYKEKPALREGQEQVKA